MLMRTSKPVARLAEYPLLRCLAIYRHMPIRFALTAVMLFAVNLALVAQQGLVGRAVHEAAAGRLVTRDAAGALDYGRAGFWVALLLGLSLARAVVQYGAGRLSLTIGQRLLTILREGILIQVQRLDLDEGPDVGLRRHHRRARQCQNLIERLAREWRDIDQDAEDA